jgi:HEAT repeat protein
MIRDNASSHARSLASALACAAALFLVTSPITTQSRIIPPQQAANANANSKRSKVTTLRATDSTEGSRVAVTADQSLNEYEAYRRGDRFYVKIPPTVVPRPETVRGRAFSDVKVQRGDDSTIVSFHLQPGATARVEPHGNKLDLVFTMPGSKLSSYPPSRNVVRNDAGPAPPLADRRQAARNANSSVGLNSLGTSSLHNPSERSVLGAKPTPSPKPSPTPKMSPAPSPTSSSFPQTSATPKMSPAVAQQKNTALPFASPPSQQTAQSTWNSMRESVRYWILLAQLNPIPVGIGAAFLLFLIGLLILQRRRARATRRARLRQTPKRVQPVPAKVTRATPVTAKVEPAIAPATAVPVASKETAANLETSGQSVINSQRQDQTDRVSGELKKLMAGGNYDESVLATEDREMRQLVGAELLSALVGRNLQRRERARSAFMKHGYFDDATRDLRIAESPNERAGAARRLSFVHDREATPHLIAALEDSSPDVRRAAVEALMDLRDPAAIAALNSLMQNENDRRVPRSLIKHAIESCATTPDEPVPTPPMTEAAPLPISTAVETEREVIEI